MFVNLTLSSVKKTLSFLEKEKWLVSHGDIYFQGPRAYTELILNENHIK